MDCIRVVLTHPAEMTVEAKLNLLGTQQLLEQEGVMMEVVPAAALDGAELSAGDVLVVAELDCLSDAEEAAIVSAARDLPIVFVGVPREGASAEFLALLGITHAEHNRDGLLRHLHLRDHDITKGLGRPHEARLKLKYVNHLTLGTKIDGRELMTIGLADGMPLAPGLVLRDESPRRAVFTFPVGHLFALSTGRHIVRKLDHEWLDWPVMGYIDVLRVVLRKLLQWSQPTLPLLRPYYWPVSNGVRPSGVLSLTHDLCGYSEVGVERICEVCAEFNVPTTFFDMPPLRLSAGEVGNHCIALHVSDTTPQEEIDEGIRALEELHGRTILGWRRHGSTSEDSYPGIWHRIKVGGIVWANTWPAQSHANRSTCSPCGTANRLPHDIMDVETGERMDLLELPIFDTDDADRLGSIGYGMRLTWDEFADMVAKRLDHAAKHGLVAGYLLHGWTAGVDEESGTRFGAHEAQRMLPHIIREALARGMMVMDGDEMYRWWSFRRACRIESDDHHPRLIAPDDSFRAELEIFPAIGAG